MAVLTPNGSVWIVPLLQSASDILLRNWLQIYSRKAKIRFVRLLLGTNAHHLCAVSASGNFVPRALFTDVSAVWKGLCYWSWLFLLRKPVD